MRYLLIKSRKYFSLLKALVIRFRFLHILSNFISFKIKKAKIWGYPSLVQIEPTNRCNLHCQLCPTGQNLLTRPLVDMKFEQFKSIIDKLKNHIIYLVLYVVGEPLLNNDILKMVKYARTNNIYVRFSTNVTDSCFKNGRDYKKVMDSGINELIISLDCLDKDSYREYKGYDGFDQVIKNIKGMMKERGRRLSPFVHLQLIVTRDNENGLDKFINLGKELGVDSISFKTVCINLYGFRNKQNYLPINRKYVRKVYLEDDKTSCYKPWISTTVLSDGSVVPCCFDMNADIKLGNILEEDFAGLWNSIEYVKFRNQILKDINGISLCRGCPGKNIPQNFLKSFK